MAPVLQDLGTHKKCEKTAVAPADFTWKCLRRHEYYFLVCLAQEAKWYEVRIGTSYRRPLGRSTPSFLINLGLR